MAYMGIGDDEEVDLAGGASCEEVREDYRWYPKLVQVASSCLRNRISDAAPGLSPQ